MWLKSNLQKILIICSLIFFVRIILSLLPSFEIDMNAWLGWAIRLKDVGPAGFYSDDVWTQYTPLFLYWLWLIGKIGFLSPLAIKIPVIFADIATGLIIWKLIKPKSEKLAYVSLVLYTLSPVLIFTGSVWGQIDGIFALLLLLASYFLIVNKKADLSGFFWALAFLLKPQAFVFLPAALFIMVARKYHLKDYLYFGILAGVTILILSLPFFPNDPIFGILHLTEKMTGFYHYTSVFAFNFWALVGMWKADDITYLGISYYVWGILLYLLSISIIFYRFRSAVQKNASAFVLMTLAFLASFLFPTRVHERYLFPAFSLLLVGTGLSQSIFLFLIFIGLSVLNFINLYHPYAYYSENFLKNESLLSLTGNLAPSVGILSIAIGGFLIKFVKHKNLDAKLWQLIKRFFKNESKQVLEVFPKVNLKEKRLKILLLAVLGFALVTRLYSLSNPQAEYFDEVYHAFTARQMLHGDPKAWEWWNDNPEGFAYEWTHPPIAKYGMVLGMAIFGENSFGWRIPGALLGVVSVYLVYLIAKRLFKDELLGVLAAFIFSLDGLALVMSRIGMNDIYLLTFALASIHFFIKDKNFLSSIFLGLALSSKWSALWVFPIIFVGHFLLRKKLRLSYLLFIFLPVVVYLVSYIPFFTSGHTFVQFINLKVFTECFGKSVCTEPYGLQQQMWWYHTNLKATHAYTSVFWTWPLDIRPVYLYTSELVDGLVSRIYLIGNPFVFWAGFAAVIVASVIAFIKRNITLTFLLFCYFVFFVPWAVSPRIMFLYHYFPSIPFLAITLAYILRKYPKIIVPTLIVLSVSFIYFYPHWTGLKIPEWLDLSYYWFPSWR